MPDARPHGRLEPLLGALVLALGLMTVSTFLTSAAARLAYPYELEWLESGVLQQTARVLEHKPLYAPPSAEFAATIHPPLYAWSSALVARVAGLGFLAPRLVSLLASLGMALLVGRAAARIGMSARAGIIAGALVLAAYVPVGTVLDLARLDALWVFLLLAATTLAASAERNGPHALAAAAAAGVLLGLATAAKQPGAAFAFLLAGALLLAAGRASTEASREAATGNPVTHAREPAVGGHPRRDPRGILRATTLLAAWAAITAAIYGGLHITTAGWSTTYLVAIPLRVPHHAAALLHLVRDDLLSSFAPSCILLLLWAVVAPADRPGGPFPLAWWAGSAAALLATISMRTIQGGGANTLLPAVVFGATLTGSVLGRVLRHPLSAPRVVALMALVVQFLRLAYSPTPLAPSLAERATAAGFVERLRAIPGDVWVPSHVSYAWLAGKPFHAGRDPLLDLLYSGHPAFPDDLETRLRTGGFAAVVLDTPFTEPRLKDALAEGYELHEEIAEAPLTRVMHATTPRLLYTPRHRDTEPASGTTASASSPFDACDVDHDRDCDLDDLDEFEGAELGACAESNCYAKARDEDGDGCLSGADGSAVFCGAATASGTVLLDGCDTGVENTATRMGCDVAGILGFCARDPARARACRTRLLTRLVREGVIRADEVAAIVACATPPIP